MGLLHSPLKDERLRLLKIVILSIAILSKKFFVFGVRLLEMEPICASDLAKRKAGSAESEMR